METTYLLSLTFLLVGLFPRETMQCGIVTHINIGQRATQYFEAESNGVKYKELINNNQDAFQAGNPFPDTFYNSLCRNGQFHQVSEDTHWVPFTNATINYIRRKYPQPWSPETQKLVAFLFGIVSHSVSDTTWHSLGIDQGFLRAMGNVNFFGSFNKAHSTGDFGGDVVNMVESDVHQIDMFDNWYIPVTDMLEIYKEFYGYERMDNNTIVECSVWMYLGRAGEKLGVINLLYPRYSNKSPFLVNRMQDYYLGAMDDMSAWVTNGWRNTVTMLDKGTSACKLPKNENPLYVNCTGDGKGVEQGRSRGDTLRFEYGTNHADYVKKIIADLDESYVNVEESERGIYIKPSDKLREKYRLAKEKLEAKRQVDHTHESSPATSYAAIVKTGDFFYDTSNNYARLGRSMASADMNNDGHTDLIIGAPGHGAMGNYMQGRVYIVYGSAGGLPEMNLTLDTDANVKVDGTEKNGMFGHAVAVVDLNKDGINDLAVSAPSVGSPDLTYHGEVYVYFGHSSGGISSKPNITVGCTQRYCNLGWSLASGDANGDSFADLLIGAPFAPAGNEQNGFVGALFSKSANSCLDNPVLREVDLDWVSNGPQRYGWYGYDISASSNNIVIGAPAHKVCVWVDCKPNTGDMQAVGKVFVFKTPLTSASTAWRTLIGNKEFDYLGTRVLIGNFAGQDNTLAFGVPTRDTGLILPTKQAGVTRVYDISASSGLVKQCEYQGKRSHARFGMGSWFEDVDGDGVNDMLVGSPHWTDGYWFDTGALRGRVFVFSGSKCSGTIKNADIELSYDEDAAKFGTSLTSVRGSDGVHIAVGAPGSRVGAKLSGRVVLFSQKSNLINY